MLKRGEMKRGKLKTPLPFAPGALDGRDAANRAQRFLTHGTSVDFDRFGIEQNCQSLEF